MKQGRERRKEHQASTQKIRTKNFPTIVVLLIVTCRYRMHTMCMHTVLCKNEDQLIGHWETMKRNTKGLLGTIYSNVIEASF